MLGILVETARGYQSVPRDHRILPEPPAMIRDLALESHALSGFFISAVFADGGDQSVRVVLVIIDLRGFQPNGIYPDFSSQALHVLDLVLVGLDHQKLKYDKGRFAF